MNEPRSRNIHLRVCTHRGCDEREKKGRLKTGRKVCIFRIELKLEAKRRENLLLLNTQVLRCEGRRNELSS